MTNILAVYKGAGGFVLKPITVKALDMKDISKACNPFLMTYNVFDFELFAYSSHYKEWKSIAQHTGRGWVRISIFVDNWEKYAVPSWVKQVKGNPYYFEKGL